MVANGLNGALRLRSGRCRLAKKVLCSSGTESVVTRACARRIRKPAARMPSHDPMLSPISPFVAIHLAVIPKKAAHRLFDLPRSGRLSGLKRAAGKQRQHCVSCRMHAPGPVMPGPFCRAVFARLPPRTVAARIPISAAQVCMPHAGTRAARLPAPAARGVWTESCGPRGARAFRPIRCPDPSVPPLAILACRLPPA